MKDFAQWEGFEGNRWKEQINVRDLSVTIIPL